MKMYDNVTYVKIMSLNEQMLMPKELKGNFGNTQIGLPYLIRIKKGKLEDKYDVGIVASSVNQIDDWHDESSGSTAISLLEYIKGKQGEQD